MKKLDVSPPTFTVAPASISDLQPAPRLIVLVPESEVDAAILARKIRELANNLESRVQLIGLSKDAAHEPGVRRRLVTLSAMVEDPHVFVQTNIEFGNNWLNAVKPHWHSGDVIVCFSEQNSGISGKPLNQILESNLHATVYVITGIQQTKERSFPFWKSNTLAWTGSIGLILAFLWLQLKLTQPPQDWAQTLLLYTSLFAEAGSIWFWNNLFN